VPNRRRTSCGAAAWLTRRVSIISLSAFATRRCRSSAAVTIAEGAVRASACGGIDIAKPIVEIVDHVGEWIADVTFSTKTLFARSGPHASCSF
jgi:hypothetical protein